ncbi:MAG: HAD-IIA family hydrolase [Lachnospiraceae bacterium]|nr:HAD-IIA family hydrolase [Lachnospiraceae bacterium]
MDRDLFGADAARLRDKKLWLFDMDGTIYLGNQVFPGTVPLFREIRRRGARYMLVTNNSSRSRETYVEKVRKMGIDAAEDDFYTSVDATIEYLKEHFPKALVYVQATRACVDQLRDAGIWVTEAYDRDADVVLVGFDTELTFEKLNRTSEMLTGFKGAYLATNPDLSCPTEYGYVPDCGSMCIGLKNATGLEPFVIGKPEPTMLEMAVKLAGLTKEDAVMVGDRLYTDIASGVNAGIDTICVLSGEATLDEILAYDKKPRWVFRDVSHISEVLSS